eukprot:6175971-Pleurochrysis_carterae.AAC.1
MALASFCRPTRRKRSMNLHYVFRSLSSSSSRTRLKRWRLIAANVGMSATRMATTPSTTPTTDGGYDVDNNAVLVNVLAPRLNKDEKDTARYAEAKIWLKAQRACEHDASLRPSKKAVTLFP